jgi:DNA-binding XRE family transcriptional regulator
MDPDEKDSLAKKIATSKKPISTKELAEKYEVPTWQIRRAIAEILVPNGKGSTEKVGSSLTYTPA